MASPKPKRKPKPRKGASEKPQSERFKETARKLGIDKTGTEFERALKLVLPSKRKRA